MSTQHHAHASREKVEDSTKRRTLPKVAVDCTPDSKSTKSWRTPASLENRIAQKLDERNKLRHKVLEPTSDETTKCVRQPRKLTKTDLVETPRRKSEVVTKSRPLVVSNKLTNGVTATPTVIRRSAIDFSTPDWYAPVSIGNTPALRENLKRQSEEAVLLSEDDIDMDVQSSCVIVAVRVRPFVQREMDDADVKSVISMIENETIVTTDKGDVHRFTFDHSFWSFDESSTNYASQTDVYKAVGQPLLAKVFEGYNACLLAYGPTGSGKSFSMTGPSSQPGIIPQFCEELFSRITRNSKEHMKTIIEISFFEIYNEKIHDLLASSNEKGKGNGKKTNLKVREHPSMGPYVEGLSSYVVTSYDDIGTWLSVGNKRRATAATGMNDTSSRSHSVFSLELTRTMTDMVDGEPHDHSSTSKVNLVDLAGSERQQMAKTTGDRLREGVSINKSLHMLGKVISVLAEQSTAPANKRKKLHIPYRDSILTWLLKESLGGNSQTAMLATISPSSFHIEDTLSTLRYAKQARTIVNVARVNEDATARLVRVLREQIEKLKSHTALAHGIDDVTSETHREIAWLREQLMNKEAEMAEINRAWLEKQQKSEEQKLEESRRLEREGIAVTSGCNRPKLVNLAENPQLSEMLEYELREGLSRVGSWKEDATREILLRGPLIADDHCVFECTGSLVTLRVAANNAQVFVNGAELTHSTILHHGDRVILGDHYFRFCNPLELPTGAYDERHLRDFEFARQELAAMQNARLEAQLEQERILHEQELQCLRQQHKDAERNMDVALAETKETAKTQQHQYEQQLHQLEYRLNEAKYKVVESEMDGKEKAALIERLANEKQNLEREVAEIRQRLNVISEPVVYDGDVTLPIEGTFIEKMLQVKNDFDRRLEEQLARSKEQYSPASARHMNLYHLMQMVHEANSISTRLNKQTEFSRESVFVGEDQQETVIRVTRAESNITTVWSLDKFEERLTAMRQIYNDPDSYSEAYIDDVFYDPDDAWSTDSRFNSSKLLSPHMLKGLRRQSNIAPMQSKCDVSLFSQSMLEDFDELDVTTTLEPVANITRVFDVCQQLVRRSVDTLKDFDLQGRVCYCDKVLMSCQCLEASLSSLILHRDSHSSETLVSDMQTCVQLQADYGSLVVLFSDWSSSCDRSHEDADINDKFQTGLAIISSVGSKLLLLMQGCSQNIKTMVSQSSNAIRGNVLTLCQLSGQIAFRQRLVLPRTGNNNMNTDGPHVTMNPELRQQFIAGCDTQLGQLLHLALEKVEDCEMKIIDCSEVVSHSIMSPVKNQYPFLTAMSCIAMLADGRTMKQFEKNSSFKLNTLVEEMLKQVQIVVSSTRLLLQKLQTVQAQDNDLTEDDDSEQRLSCDYGNLLALGLDVDTFMGSSAKLAQAAENIVQGRDVQSSLRVVGSCADDVLEATASVVSHSTASRQQQTISSLSDSQTEIVDLATSEVQSAVEQLKVFVNKCVR